MFAPPDVMHLRADELAGSSAWALTRVQVAFGASVDTYSAAA